MKPKPDPKSVEKTVADLRQRIQKDRAYLARNETRTRIVAIDPLLRALGWDPERSEDVQLEFDAGNHRLDYALMLDGEPVAVIEAKRLGSDLGAKVHLQVLKYAKTPECSGIRLVAFTNGDEWILCRESDDWNDARLTISSEQPFKTAFELAEYLAPSKFGAVGPKKPRRAKGIPTASQHGKWYPLVGDLPDKLPKAVRLDDETPTNWVSWRELYANVAEFLYATGFISEADAPVYVANGKYCAINKEPVHPGPEAKQFGNAVQIGENLWLETYGNRNTLRDYAGRLMRKFHNDPECVQLRYD